MTRTASLILGLAAFCLTASASAYADDGTIFPLASAARADDGTIFPARADDGTIFPLAARADDGTIFPARMG